MNSVESLTRCSHCGADTPASAEICRVCKTPLRSGKSFDLGRVTSVLNLLRTLLGLVVALAVIGWVVTHRSEVQEWFDDVFAVSRFEPTYQVPAPDEIRGVGVAPRDDACPGEGARICLVAIGDGADRLVSELVTYLSGEQNLPIAGVLPRIDLGGAETQPGSLLNADRGQIDSQGLIALMSDVYPAAVDRDVMLLGVTRYDMYNSELDELRYLFTTRATDPGLLAVISTARLEPASYGYEGAERLLDGRVRKVALRDIGFLHLELPVSDDATSLLTASINSLADLDALVGGLPTVPQATPGPRLPGGESGIGPALFGPVDLGEGDWLICFELPDARQSERASLIQLAYEDGRRNPDADRVLAVPGGGGSCQSYRDRARVVEFQVVISPGTPWTVTMERQR